MFTYIEVVLGSKAPVAVVIVKNWIVEVAPNEGAFWKIPKKSYVQKL